MNSLSRADLLRVLVRLGDAAGARAAARLGYREAFEDLAIPVSDILPEARASSLDLGSQPKGTLTKPRRSLSLYRIVRRKYVDDPAERSETTSDPPLAPNELHLPSPRAPAPPARTRWEDWASPLHRALKGTTVPGRLDIDRLVERVAHCESINPLPRHVQRHISTPVWVVIDVSAESRPMRTEYRVIIDGLRSLLGRSQMRLFDLPGGPDGSRARAIARSASPGDRVVALADPTRRTSPHWTAFGQRLLAHTEVLIMMSPAGRPVPLPWRRVVSPTATPDSHIDSVLVRLAHCSVFDHAALRIVVDEVDPVASLEWAVWNDSRVRRGADGQAFIDEDLAKEFHAAFAELPKDVKAKSIGLLAERVVAPQVWAEELLSLRAVGLGAMVPEEHRNKAVSHLRRLLAAVDGNTLSSEERRCILAWFRCVYERLPVQTCEINDELVTVVSRLAILAREERRELGRSASHRLYVRGKTLSAQGHRNDVSFDLPAIRPQVRVSRLIPSWASRGGVDAFGEWAAFEVAGVEQVMRRVPAGSFVIGSTSDQENHRSGKSRRRAVLVDPYWIANSPCTQALWSAVLMGGSQPSTLPVDNVSYNDVLLFIDQLNVMIPGLNVALPTETQWERACRADSEIVSSRPIGALAWFRDNSGGYAHRVMQRAPNGWGLFDMLGNVAEWCSDGVDDDTNLSPVPDGYLFSRTSSGEHAFRIVRGGSWLDSEPDLRSVPRCAYAHDSRWPHVGFRLSRSESRGSATVVMDPDSIKSSPLDDGTSVSVDLRGGTRVQTDLVSIDFEPLECPYWAESFGRDEYGLFADVDCKPSTKPVGLPHEAPRSSAMRMRWIAPGRFTEVSSGLRKAREMRRRFVDIDEGFWIADAPCTRAFWAASVGTDEQRSFVGRLRSLFARTPHRQTSTLLDLPVVDVSYADIEVFLGRLERLRPGVRFRLPTELEWEFSCRSGTTGATYARSVAALGERDPPGLDAIAWYGGSDAEVYALSAGTDASSGEGRQYSSSKAGPQPVRTRRPNLWGLYDMLGNVWEWCGVEGAGSNPCARGGAWSSPAKEVSADCRMTLHRSHRSADLGFRFVLDDRA